jgi:membrane protease YdiL (CAAX protease family)
LNKNSDAFKNEHRENKPAGGSVHGGSEMNFLAAWLVLLLFLGFSLPSFRRVVKSLNRRFGDWTVGFLFLPYLLAVRFHPSWQDVLRMLTFISLPTLLMRFRSKKAKPFDPFQVLAILAIWIPIEPSLFILILDLILPGVDLQQITAGFYLLPTVRATLFSEITLPIPTLIAASLALYLFVIRHPLRWVGYTFHFSWQDIKSSLQGLLIYALIGVPTGLLMGFLHFNPNLPSLTDLVAGILAGYLLVALIEEILFRGVIQNSIAKRFKNSNIALIIASVLFGLAHLNNATEGFPIPNWGYVLMATLAGLAYGWVWHRTRKVTASAITHMLVNLAWGVVFT